MNQIELSVVMPCLNEAATVQICIAKAKGCLQRLGVNGEIIVADNGSTDGSRELAAAAGARVVRVQEKGYGAALRAGIAAAEGRYIILGDADDSYDFSRLDVFVEKLREGFQLVMGNRFKGGIKAGAMPKLHRYLGNPVLSFVGRLFFGTSIGDFHCGLRGFEREAILRIGLTAPGMEFASEMVVKASLARLKIVEVPTTLSPDGRNRPPHLRSWRDGWRHLRFLLMFSPRWLFLYPGAALFLLGATIQGLLIHGGVKIGSIGLDIHTMLYGSAMSIMGVQMIWFAIFARVFCARMGVLPRDSRLEQRLGLLTLERGLAIGIALMVGGIVLTIYAMSAWANLSFGALDPQRLMRVTIPAISMILMGMEIILASFFLGILRIEQPNLIVAPPVEESDGKLKPVTLHRGVG